jgi:hypothetical protein
MPYILGLNSGSSFDGVDAVLCTIELSPGKLIQHLLQLLLEEVLELQFFNFFSIPRSLLYLPSTRVLNK